KAASGWARGHGELLFACISRFRGTVAIYCIERKRRARRPAVLNADESHLQSGHLKGLCES
ncbi:MAG: hypothetical protein ACRD9W_27695, partial [Terriglobia bacterium]